MTRGCCRPTTWRPSEPAGRCSASPVFSAFHSIIRPGRDLSTLQCLCFLKSATACLFPSSSSFFCQLKPCSAIFAGSFLWQVFLLTNFLVFSLDGTGVDLSGEPKAHEAGLEWEIRQLPGLCLLSFWPPQTLPPTSSHTRTFQGWGEPQDSQGRVSIHSWE